ncbi:hypothetical protein GS507_14150 [Rhodococcus hoagii]|nr:hypothetical protein [Prescottella equi]
MRDRHYRMSSSRHRDGLSKLIYAPHVKELNAYVDTLQARKPVEFVPYVSPEFGGSAARMLLLTLSPGEQTRPESPGGSGFLYLENTDPAASRIAEALDLTGVKPTDCIGWNVYPWYMSRLGNMPLSEQDPFLRQGVDVLIQVIARLPELRAVFVFGRGPERAWWNHFGKEYPRTRRSVGYFYHRSTGPQGYQGTRAQQEEWRRELIEEMANAKQVIGGPSRI